MAIFSVDEAIEILKSPRDEALELAEWHEKRLCMHSVPSDRQPYNEAFDYWLTKIESRLDDAKYAKFLNLLEYPLPTVDFTESVYSELEKIFEAQDAFKEVVLKNPNFNDDVKTKIVETEKFMRTEGFDQMKTSINSILVTDLPAEQEGFRPKPYSYFLNICHVQHVGMNSYGPVEYLDFDTGLKDGDNPIRSFMDGGSYRLFIERGENFELMSERPHDLGVTPAHPFWSTFYNKKQDLIRRKGPISTTLGRLDSLLFKETSKEHSDLYLLYPMIWHLPQDGSFKDDSAGNDANSEDNANDYYQENGNNYYRYGNAWYSGVNYTKAIPNKKFSGAGTGLTKPLPTTENPDVGDPAGFIAPDSDSLEAITKDLAIKKQDTWHSILGIGGEASNDQAKNEKQIQAGFESRDQVLKNTRKNFDIIERWKIWVECALTYGPDQIMNVTVTGGSQFNLPSADALKETHELTKKLGLSTGFVSEERKQIVKSKFKNNPNIQERLEMLQSLDPYPLLSTEQALNFKGTGKLNDNLIDIKVNLESLTQAFEMTNGPIQDFAPDLPLDARIMLIKEEYNSIFNEGTIYGSYSASAQEEGPATEGR